MNFRNKQHLNFMTNQSLVEVNIFENLWKMPSLERREFIKLNPYPEFAEKTKADYKKKGFEFVEMKNSEVMVFRKLTPTP